MSLGTNRDYKTTDRRARRNLEAHAARMKELIAQGMDSAAASRQALNDILYPVRNFEEEARVFIAAKLNETAFLKQVPSDNRPAARKAYRKVKKSIADTAIIQFGKDIKV
jgi:hypothetical protein